MCLHQKKGSSEMGGASGTSLPLLLMQVALRNGSRMYVLVCLFMFWIGVCVCLGGVLVRVDWAVSSTWSLRLGALVSPRIATSFA
jgi:hypothetical protein